MNHLTARAANRHAALDRAHPPRPDAQRHDLPRCLPDRAPEGHATTRLAPCASRRIGYRCPSHPSCASVTCHLSPKATLRFAPRASRLTLRASALRALSFRCNHTNPFKPFAPLMFYAFALKMARHTARHYFRFSPSEEICRLSRLKP